MVSVRVRVLCAGADPAAIASAVIGWLIPGVLLAPSDASLSATQVGEFYATNPTAVRVGLVIAIPSRSGVGAALVAVVLIVLAVVGTP